MWTIPGLSTIILFMGKLMERVEENQLHAFLEVTNCLVPFQSGFRFHPGTETVLITDNGSQPWECNLVGPRPLSGLWYHWPRLSSFRVGGLALSWVCSFLEHGTQKVLSLPFGFFIVVFHRATPTLFNIYMRPLGEVIWSFWVCCHQYMDDTSIFLNFLSLTSFHSANFNLIVLTNVLIVFYD